ncbi:TolC family protein [Mariniblastus sp.]|nr:TolC family protein [Mariniblastus sp.]
MFRALAILCAGGLLLVSTGCHRSRAEFRKAADLEACQLIRQKTNDPRWDSATGNIQIDPVSRLFDPFCPDHIPLPPDDPTSHRLMHCVDCKPGYPCWHAYGDQATIDTGNWRSSLPINELGQVVLDLDSAYQLALLHSPDLQQQRETLYLSALDVSLQRFGFDSQLFAGFNSFLTTQGRQRTGTGRSSTTLSNQLGANGEGINFNKLGITGTTLTAGIANTILWNFSGNNTQTANSLVNFSLIQPLLRDAGRERILESLTQTERTLLANVRQLARFRRGLFLQIAVGRNSNSGLSLGGDFLDPPAPATSNVGGFVGLQQQQKLIRNQAFIVKQLERVLDQFRELFLRERINAIQVKQFESTVFQQQQSLLVARNQYLNSLDNFKQLLGLPPDLEVVIEDPFLNRFELIDDQLNNRLDEVAKLRNDAGLILSDLSDLLIDTELIEPDATDDSDATDVDRDLDLDFDDVAAQLKALQKELASGQRLANAIIEQDQALIKADLVKLGEVRQDRLDYLAVIRKQLGAGTIDAGVELSLFDDASIPQPDELDKILTGEIGLVSVVKKIRDQLTATSETLDEFLESGEATSKADRARLTKTLQSAPEQLGDLANVLLDMSLLQAKIRSNSIEITDVELAPSVATEIARSFRRDWMNARASLVDQWRQIEFVADQLEGNVDLVFEGDIGNVTDNPFRLNYENGQLRAGLRFDAPIVRLAERNDYREAIILYEQDRRRMYQFEDEVKRNLRQTLRTIEQDKVLFELNRRSVQVNIEQVELNRFALEEPVRPGEGGGLGATTARDLTQALTGLNSALNDILQTWVEYESLRMNLDFDLGTMQLDDGFRWVDPGKIDVGVADFAASMMGLNVTGVGFSAVDTLQQNESLQVPPSSVEVPQPAFEEESPAVELLEPELSPPSS